MMPNLSQFYTSGDSICYQPQPWVPVIYGDPEPDTVTVTVPQITTRIVKDPQEDRPMRGLFNVHIVDPEKSEIVTSVLLLIAKGADDAKLKALAETLKADADFLDKDLDEYDIIVVRLGDVRARKEVQEVKVVR